MSQATNTGMRIDAHQHYWRYDSAQFPWIDDTMGMLQRDFLPADVAPLMDATGITAAIAVQARCLQEETAWLLELAHRDRRIAAVVGWVDLQAADVAERLSYWCADAKLRGIRHVIQDDPEPAATLNNASFNRGVRAVQAHDLAYDVLVQAKDLQTVIDFCARHDRAWLMLDHAGKPSIGSKQWLPWADHIVKLAALPHVACKLSGLVTEAGSADYEHLAPYAAHVLEHFGTKRTLFGSDWPVCTEYAGYQEVTTLVERALVGLTTSERAEVFGETALHCYGLTMAPQH